MHEATRLLGSIIAKRRAKTPAGAVNMVLREARDSSFLDLEDINRLFSLAREQFQNGMTVGLFIKEDEDNGQKV